MKKILLTTCFIVISLATFAQMPSIGVKGGVNFATMATSNDGTNKTSGSLTTFNAGVFVDFKFGNLSLQPALNYTGKGETYQQFFAVPGPNMTESGGSSLAKVHLYYLELPVNLVYHIPVIIGNIYFGAGPYIAQGISGNTSYTNGFSSEKVTFGNGESDLEGTQFGVDAIIGFKLKNGLLINANYDLGLSNDIPSAADSGSGKSRVFGISVGYVFL